MPENFRRTLWTHIGIAAGGVAVLTGVILWLAADVRAQTDRVVKDRELIRAHSASIAALAALKRGAPQAIRYEEKLNAFLPTQDQLLDFPRTLDNLARVRKLALNFSFQGGQVFPQGTMPGEVGFALDVTGTFDDVLGFMKDVEVEPPRFLASFDSFDLTRSGEEYRLSAHGKVFFQ